MKQCQGSKVVLLLKDPMLTAGGHVGNGTVPTACSFFRKCQFKKVIHVTTFLMIKYEADLVFTLTCERTCLG